MQNLMQIHCSTHALILNRQPHSTHAHSTVSTAPTDQYSEVVIVHACAFQSLSLAARLHCGRTDCSNSINNSWIFSGQLMYVSIIYLSIYLSIIYLQIYLLHKTLIQLEPVTTRLGEPCLRKLSECVFTTFTSSLVSSSDFIS